MPDRDSRERRSSPEYPEAEYVGPHLVIDKTDWLPGEHAEPHLREAGQTGYLETYFRCIQCGMETTRKADFPPECNPSDGPS